MIELYVAIWFNKKAYLSKASCWISGSTPLSKRCEASVARPYFLAWLTIVSGLKKAASTAMLEVLDETADLSLPMMPAIAWMPDWSWIVREVDWTSFKSPPITSSEFLFDEGNLTFI